MTSSALFTTANLLLHLGSLLCFIAVVVQMFSQDESGWGIACILLLFCGCGQLIAFIYGWTKVGEWEISLLMLAWTLCIIGAIIQVMLMFALGGLPTG